jgi:predicted nuclease with TOPRIM domain
MIKKNKAKTEYITSKDLAEQTKIILGAIDGRFNKVDDRFNKMDNRFDKMDGRFDRIDNRFDRMDTRIDELETELKADINNVQTLIDGYVKAQEDFKQEFVIMKEEMRIMKMIFKEKLGVEVRAF